MKNTEFLDGFAPPPPPPKPRPPMSVAAHIRDLSHRHSTWQVFTDFLELAACSISNRFDLAQYDAREARYMEIIKRYSKEEATSLAETLADLILQIDREGQDVLGKTYHELELHNKWHGQFFTPYHLSRMMAKMTIGTDLQKIIEEKGFITVCEPCVGSGTMLLAFGDECEEQGIDLGRVHMTGVDVDLKCVHMAFLQLSLRGIPAVLAHGNSLSAEEWSRWYTPAHIIGGWTQRLGLHQRRSVLIEPGEAKRTEPEVVAKPEVKPVIPAAWSGTASLFEDAV
jgi:hypothetical protein